MAAELPGALLRPFELAINHGIGRSATAAAIAAELDGRALLVRADGWPWPLRLVVTAGRVQLGTAHDPADVAITGTPLTLLRLLTSDPQALFRDGELKLSGSTDMASAFQELLKFAAPDLEDLLSRAVGDPAAHQLGGLARGLGAFATRAAESLGRSVGEFLTEEQRVLASRFEVDEFNAAVDELAQAADRAEARLALLKARKSPP